MLKFLNGFKNAISGGEHAAKAQIVLLRTYSLSLDRNGQEELRRIATQFREVMNEHEVALKYLCEFSRKINPEHPKALAEVTKYVRMAKGARVRGLVNSDFLLDELLDIARMRFKLEPNSIEAA
jgi:hypothetical protein